MYLLVQPQPLVHPSNTLTVCTFGSSLSLWSTLPTPSLYVPLGPASAFDPPFQHPHCMYLWVQPQPLARPSNILNVCTSGSSLSLWSTLRTSSQFTSVSKGGGGGGGSGGLSTHFITEKFFFLCNLPQMNEPLKKRAHLCLIDIISYTQH